MQTVDDFLLNLPADERSVVTVLRKIILSTSDKFTEKFAYCVPYFYIHSRVCFTWPASMGAITFDKGVALGFCRGHLLSNDNGLLNGRGRKEVWDVIYEHPSQVDAGRVRETLIEAILLDEEMARKKKRK